MLDTFDEVVTLVNKFSVEARTSIRKKNSLRMLLVCGDNYVVVSFNPESWQNISFRRSKDVQHKNLVEVQIITKDT